MRSLWAVVTSWWLGLDPVWRWNGLRWRRSRFAWLRPGDRFRFGRPGEQIEGTVIGSPYLALNPKRNRLESGIHAELEGDY